MDKSLPNFRSAFGGYTEIKIVSHSSEKRGSWSTLKPREMIQNLLCLWEKKTHVVFFVFHLEQLSFSPYECPGLCRHRPGHL